MGLGWAPCALYPQLIPLGPGPSIPGQHRARCQPGSAHVPGPKATIHPLVLPSAWRWDGTDRALPGQLPQSTGLKWREAGGHVPWTGWGDLARPGSQQPPGHLRPRQGWGVGHCPGEGGDSRAGMLREAGLGQACCPWGEGLLGLGADTVGRASPRTTWFSGAQSPTGAAVGAGRP